MDPRVMAALAADGVITRQRALEIGIASHELDRAVRHGELRRVRRGAYVLPALLDSATLLSERQRLRDRAACLRVPEPFVRSHSTAALELGLGILLPPRPVTHVTQQRHGIKPRFGISYHVAPYRLDQVVEVNGFRVLEPGRTALDIAREDGFLFGLVAIDRARHAGVSLADLEQTLDQQMHFWPNRRRALQAVELSDARSESVAETLGRSLLIEMGILDIDVQFGLTDGRREHFADLRVGRQLFEIDGFLKYLKASDGGVAVRSTEATILDEKGREDWFRGFHLGVSRLVWSDVWGPGRAAAKLRLAREMEATNRLWGTSIDDLARFRVERRAA